MDTQFDDCVFFLLSTATFQYRTGVFRPPVFENRLTRADVEVVLSKIYYKTQNFASLRDRLLFGKKWNLANIMLIVLMLLLLIVAFQQFQTVYVVVFLLAAVIVFGYYIYLACTERSLEKAIGEYEGMIETILEEANKELIPKQMKFTVMKEYMIIILQAEYKKINEKPILVAGSKDLQPFFNASRVKRPRAQGRGRRNDDAIEGQASVELNPTMEPHQALGRASGQQSQSISGTVGMNQVSNQQSQKGADVHFKAKIKYTRINMHQEI